MPAPTRAILIVRTMFKVSGRVVTLKRREGDGVEKPVGQSETTNGRLRRWADKSFVTAVPPGALREPQLRAGLVKVARASCLASCAWTRVAWASRGVPPMVSGSYRTSRAGRRARRPCHPDRKRVVEG